MLAVVSGGSRGIGLDIVKALLKEGYTVVATARKIDERVTSLPSYNKELFFKQTDISNKDSREELLSYAKSFGKIDLLVNNAGVAPKERNDILELSEEAFDYLLDVNLKGTFFMCQLFGKYFLENKSGKIINVSSVSSYAASTNRGEYCIAKAGISMVTKLFASELASSGVGVFEISPGIIDTEMIQTVREKYVTMIENGLTPLPRLGKGEDIANCVVAISKGYLDFCVGQVLNADGGFSIRRL